MPKMNKEEIAIQEIIQEFKRASDKFGSFASTHEGYAVILEELDELWDEIKTNSNPRAQMRKEAIQVAAMGFRFIVDCC